MAVIPLLPARGVTAAPVATGLDHLVVIAERGGMIPRIWIRRAYEPPTRHDGYRVLVDRMWPRGVPRQEGRIDEWLRDVAPSSQLRRWFAHDPGRWEEFRDRYRAELAGSDAQVDRLLERARQQRVTLIYGARDTRRNNAAVLREYLEERLR